MNRASRRVAAKIGLLCVASLFATCLSHPSRADSTLACVIIDTDVDLDDIRAIAVLAGSRRIVAIVTTEGIARSEEGAAAVKQFLQRIGAKIPVIPGESANPERDYVAESDLPRWREAAEHLNGTFSNAESPSDPHPRWIANALRPLLNDCRRVELLVIGPWTSFMRYGPELLDRINLIVAQGWPDPNELRQQPAGFNCTYDLNSCLSASDLIAGRRLRADRRLRVNWVDIPESPIGCGAAEPGIDPNGAPVYPFRPTWEWAEKLHEAGGRAKAVSDILMKDQAGWAKTALWDDLAALFLLRPDLFGARGGHWEPCVSADTVRNLLAAYMADKF
jgi:hypothetical protein